MLSQYKTVIKDVDSRPGCPFPKSECSNGGVGEVNGRCYPTSLVGVKTDRLTSKSLRVLRKESKPLNDFDECFESICKMNCKGSNNISDVESLSVYFRYVSRPIQLINHRVLKVRERSVWWERRGGTQVTGALSNVW